ncbi:glycoside hydrolase family 16 protein [Ferruginibacter sp. SUN106]|uniref:glycoside hydrolase family 16 protein n=1 Tax=Ferruginibacter sp. SUN106 TaxID=2978348 RepID=UPI003D36A2EA
MRYLKNSVILLCSFLILSSCKKGSSNGPSQTAPTNLVVTGVPSTDGSGNVAFTATADNAATYAYEFGDGGITTTTTGTTTYKYTLLGSNTFTVTVTATSNSGGTLKKTIQVTVNVVAGTPGLVWSEEFNTDGAPNSAKWGYDIGAGGWGNNEQEYYTSRPENAVVINGVLKITAKKESYSGSNYTSARLLSKDKFSFKYGKIEIRAKLPAGGGTWPAIWMLGNNIGTTPWPGCGEIDIMEHVGNQLNKIYGTLHHPGHSGANGDGSTIIIPDATTAFHNYILEWSASSIKFYVDTQLFYTFTNTASLPFNQNFFIILNVAMGGNFGGTIDPAFNSAAMEVDYIRVYQ